MRTMKSVLLLTAASLTLAACGGGEVVEASSTAPATQSSASSSPSSSGPDEASATGSDASGSSSSSSSAATGEVVQDGDTFTAKNGKFSVTHADAKEDPDSGTDVMLSLEDGAKDAWMLKVGVPPTTGMTSEALTKAACDSIAKDEKGLKSASGETATIDGEAAKGCKVYGKSDGDEAAVWIFGVKKDSVEYLVYVGGKGDLAAATKLRDEVLDGWKWVG